MTRRTMLVVSMAFLFGVLVGSHSLPSLLAQARRTALQTMDLKRIDLGSWCEGKEAIVQFLEFGPGTSGRHFHPAHSFAYMLEGSEVQLVQGAAPVTAKAGELMSDSPGEVHETRNTAPVKVLVFRIAEKGKDSTTQVPSTGNRFPPA